MPTKTSKPRAKKILSEKAKKIYYGYQRPLKEDKERRPTQEEALHAHKIMYWGLRKISDDLKDVYPAKKSTRTITKDVKSIMSLEKSLEGHLKKVEEKLLKLENKQKNTDQQIEVIQEEVAPEIIDRRQEIIDEIDNYNKDIDRYSSLYAEQAAKIDQLNNIISDLNLSLKRTRNKVNKRKIEEDIEYNKDLLDIHSREIVKYQDEINRLKNKIQYLENERISQYGSGYSRYGSGYSRYGSGYYY